MPSQWGFLEGINEGIRNGILAFDAERSRADRLRQEQMNNEVRMKQFKEKQEKDELAAQQNELMNISKGLMKVPSEYQAKPGETLHQVGKQAYAYNPSQSLAVLAAKEKQAMEPTKAESEVDTQFGKQYADWRLGGGYAESLNALDTLKGVSDALGKDKGLSGKGVGLLSKTGLEDYLTPRAAAMRQEAESAVQNTLKQTLGAQFTEREGEQVFKRLWNPAQPQDENKKRIDRFVTKMSQIVKAKEDASNYFEKNRSIRGYKGAVYDKSGVLNEVNNVLANGSNQSKGLLNKPSGSQSQVKASLESPMGLLNSMSSEDRDALDWANANPNDPRAMEIKKRLGK